MKSFLKRIELGPIWVLLILFGVSAIDSILQPPTRQSVNDLAEPASYVLLSLSFLLFAVPIILQRLKRLLSYITIVVCFVSIALIIASLLETGLVQAKYLEFPNPVRDVLRTSLVMYFILQPIFWLLILFSIVVNGWITQGVEKLWDGRFGRTGADPKDV